FSRDWSSDVCSSDLGDAGSSFPQRQAIGMRTWRGHPSCPENKKQHVSREVFHGGIPFSDNDKPSPFPTPTLICLDGSNIAVMERSEERRVGKEGISR